MKDLAELSSMSRKRTACPAISTGSHPDSEANRPSPPSTSQHATITSPVMRITSPPITYPCFYGVDMATRGELIAANMSEAEIVEHIGADSLGYLSLEGTIAATELGEGQHCTACFSGRYPSAVPLQFDKFSLEGYAVPDHEIPMAAPEPAIVPLTSR